LWSGGEEIVDNYEIEKAKYDKFKKTALYRYCWRFLEPLFIRMHVDEKEVALVQKTFKLSETIFKIAGWFTMVGLFKFLAEKSGSYYAYSIYFLLNTLLFCVLTYAAGSINFRAYPFPDTIHQRRWNSALNIILTIVLFFFVQRVMNEVISGIRAVK
jgi:hypothetical protein